MTFRLTCLTAVVIVATSCGGAGIPASAVGDMPLVTPEGLEAELSAAARPAVVNVWASWCAPCRSEAPLLRAAAAEWGDRVSFIGIDVRDTQEGGREFIADFGLTALDHRFDPSGAVPRSWGGVGVPLTYFVAAGGDIVHLHRGVIDERTLALWLDVLMDGG